MQVRVNSGNKDFHYTHWTILPDRFRPNDLSSLSDTKPTQAQRSDPCTTGSLLDISDDETTRLK
jgi:hypothetical protein